MAVLLTLLAIVFFMLVVPAAVGLLLKWLLGPYN